MATKQIKKINEIPVWKLAIRFMISFGFLLFVVLTAVELIKSRSLNAIPESFKNGTWFSFIGIRMLVIVVYGFAMAFITKKRANRK